MHYDLTTLPSGLRVITETMPSVRSVAVGCWVETGSRDEQGNEAGASHFLEHLLFKGTDDISAREISEAFDRMGAQSNAFTSKETTCFYARMLDDDLEEGVGLLTEMMQRPAFRVGEIDSERQVVIEEINMNEDDPSDVAFETFTQTLFEDHPLADPILGTKESIRAMSRDDLAGYWKRRYGAGSVVVALVGSVSHTDVVEMVSEAMGDWGGETVPHDFGPPDVSPRVRTVHRDTEQANIVIGGVGPATGDERRYPFEVMNQILGGGMASRLFQKVREEQGLAYAVYSFRMPYAETGAWGVYVGTTPSQADTAMGIIVDELAAMVDDGITAEELDRARGSVRGSLALALEDASSRMVRLGRDEINGSEHLSVDDRIARIEAVTLEDVMDVASAFLPGPRVIGAVGPFADGDLERYIA